MLGVSLHAGRPAPDEVEDQDDHRNNQKQVNERTANVREQAEKPKNSNNNGYPQQHESLPCVYCRISSPATESLQIRGSGPRPTRVSRDALHTMPSSRSWKWKQETVANNPCPWLSADGTTGTPGPGGSAPSAARTIGSGRSGTYR
jgi:hypothetical protein